MIAPTDPTDARAPRDPIAHMLAHRSIRRYRPDPVADDVLHRILEAALRASSSGNMQSYSIVVTRDRALRERLHAPHMEQDMVLEAPVLLTFCSDFHRMRRWLALSGAADGFDDPFAFAVGAIDAALASQNAALAAEAEGLGICYLGSTLANADAIATILELPQHVVPVVGFVLGHPAEEPALRDRLPLDGLVHDETYRDPDDATVRAIYRERETRRLGALHGQPRAAPRASRRAACATWRRSTRSSSTRAPTTRSSRRTWRGRCAHQGFLRDL